MFFLAGESIEAKTHENVTMLFSDIVGFTSICSTATPMQVVNMLQSLYTQFDAFCGQLDVYKVKFLHFKLRLGMKLKLTLDINTFLLI